jgi:hypothetical protein
MDMAKNVSSKVTAFLNQSMVQMSIVGGILFFILASPRVLNMVNGLVQNVTKMVGVNVSLNSNMLVFLHGVVFAVLFYVSVTFILQPLLKK